MLGHLQAVKAALSIPVIANGNVRDLADADACLAYTGASSTVCGCPAWAQGQSANCCA